MASYKAQKKEEVAGMMGMGGEGKNKVRQRPKHIGKAVVIDPEGELVSGNIQQGEDEGVKEEITMVAEEPDTFEPYEFPREEDELEEDEAKRLKELKKLKKQKDAEKAYTNVDLPPPPAPFCKLFDPRMVKGDIGKAYTVGIFGKRHTGKSFFLRWLLYNIRDYFPR